MPATHPKKWRDKFEANVERDARVQRELENLGWAVLVVWECETKPTSRDRLLERLREFLEGEGR